ncbi:MAG: PVC-type heme-binding CxxCH protein [Pirellulales bacterium]
MLLPMFHGFSQLLVNAVFAGIFCIGFGNFTARSAEDIITGPDTEARFPPLTVPAGFKVTLFACDPLVEYPSVIAIGPSPGSLFVAHDYLTGLGYEIVRKDEIRLLADTDADGYADRSNIYADGFNSIQGLAYHAGSVYVMHAPLLTKLQDTNNDGVADTRHDLLQGLGLPPEQNDNRLHCANGITVGHDRWLYLALGDRGCDVSRPEGDRLVFRAGGILRCRPDGTDLHVFSRGLRNIYDIALDQQLNVFVRDNENDGGDYMIRVYHCFHGSDHGYPYLFLDRPHEAMLPLADLGRGSSAGVAAYLETSFPAPDRNSLFACEWGRAIVQYPRQTQGSSFAKMQEADFVTGAPDDPYGFHPTDITVDHDGSLLVSDWADGQRPKRGRGRIYRISYPGTPPADNLTVNISESSKFEQLLQQLNSDSYQQRVSAQQAIEQRDPTAIDRLKRALQENKLRPQGRLHAIWTIAHAEGHAAINDLFDMAAKDSDQRVRAQAVRAIADLSDPVLTEHQLVADRGDEQLCLRLANLAKQADPRVRLEVLIALRRLHWSQAPRWLSGNWTPADPALSHAAILLLRGSENWPAVLRLLDTPNQQESSLPSLRVLALRALANQANQTVAAGLLKRLENEPTTKRRQEYLDLLARIYKKPAEWTYWGFRPSPRPANPVNWEFTSPIGAALATLLHDPDLRKFTARRMVREKIPIPIISLVEWLHQQPSSDELALILEALRQQPLPIARELLTEIISNSSHSNENRLAALNDFVSAVDSKSESQLLTIGQSLQADPVLMTVLKHFASRTTINATPLFIRHLDSSNDEVRAAAVESLINRPEAAIASRITPLLKDSDLRVRRAAAILAGQLKVQQATDLLVHYTTGADHQLRSASLQSLAKLHDPRALAAAVDALKFPECQLAALDYLKLFGNLKHSDNIATIAKNNRSLDIMTSAIETLIFWQNQLKPQTIKWLKLEQTIAQIQSDTGISLQWRILGPLSLDSAAQNLNSALASPFFHFSRLTSNNWNRAILNNGDNSIHLSVAKTKESDSIWLATTNYLLAKPSDVEFLAASTGTLTVWLNGNEIFQRKETTKFQPNTDRFQASLNTGNNRLFLRVEATDATPRFQLQFRRKSSQAEHEQLIQKALTHEGDANRGNKLFLNAAKTQCLNCHRFGNQGAQIGPDLVGIGSRFSRIHILESILEPSRTIAPSYKTVAAVLHTGKSIFGVKITESPDALTLGDTQGKIHTIPKSEIEEIQPQHQSIMPIGLEKLLSESEFIDLISFLVSEKKRPPNNTNTEVQK